VLEAEVAHHSRMAVGGVLGPVVFMVTVASVLVGVVVLKLWTAQRLLRSSAA
jgi:hypothetical protein